MPLCYHCWVRGLRNDYPHVIAIMYVEVNSTIPRRPMDLEHKMTLFKYTGSVFPLISQALDVVDEFENRLTQFSILSDTLHN